MSNSKRNMLNIYGNWEKQMIWMRYKMSIQSIRICSMMESMKIWLKTNLIRWWSNGKKRELMRHICRKWWKSGVRYGIKMQDFRILISNQISYNSNKIISIWMTDKIYLKKPNNWLKKVKSKKQFYALKLKFNKIKRTLRLGEF